MFTGLILFSEARAEDKLKGTFYLAMFELFDFNEIRTISKTDLEFLMYCCVSSALKIYGYADECPKDTEIHNMVMNAINSSRVSLNNLLHFCAFSEEVSSFIYFFKIKGLTLPKPLKKQDYFEPLRKNQHIPSKIPKIDPTIQKKIENSSKSWIAAVLNPLSQHSPSSLGTGKFSLHWVLGIKSEGTKHNIGIVPGNDILLYFTSSIVVILYCKILKQKHYTEHIEEIASITIGKDIAATGEGGNTPKIHVWRINTLETIQILSGVHQTSVTNLGFTNNEQHLISCSSYTVVIYEWRSKNILVTTNHTYRISDLHLLPRVTSSSCFILACEEEITVYSIEKDKLTVASVNLEVSMCKSSITCVAGQGIYDMKKEGTFLLLTGHHDGSVLLWEGIEFQKLVVAYEATITAIQVLVSWYAIGTSMGCIYFWDNRLDTCHKVIELSMWMFKLMSFEILSMCYVNKKLYISTKGGDVVEAKVQLESLKITPKRIDGIIQIDKGMNRLVFLSAELPFLVVSGESGVVMTVDLRSYEIIDTWAVGYSVHTLRCERFGENLFFAAGCEEGHLFIRENWDTVFKPDAGYNTITDLQFLSEGKLLIVTSESSNIYIFKKSSMYEKIYVLSVEAGVPISINLCKDKLHLLLVTEKRKLMMMDGLTYDLSYTFEDVAGLHWSNLHTYFYANLKEHSFKLPVTWNGKGDCIAASGFEGVHVWKNSSKVKTENGTILKGHIGKVSDLCLKSSLLFTLGTDGMLMYWNYENVTITLDSAPAELTQDLKKEIMYALPTASKSVESSGQFMQTAFLSSVLESSSYFFSLEGLNKAVLLSLDLKYIYGGHFQLRQSLHYIHFHNPETLPQCTRHLVYFISRYPIVFNPITQSQQFYTSHKQKVTALAMHPSLLIAASCDENNIHVWKLRERVPVAKLVSCLNSIFILKFGSSNQGGELLAAVGWDNELSGVELFNWSHETSMARVFLYMDPQDLQFHPAELFRFAVCGAGNFSIWKRSGRVLRCKLEVKLPKVLTVMRYLAFKQRKEVDLLIGTNQGELIISVEGKLLVHVNNAHEGAVLSIATTEYLGSGLVFTGGEDGAIRIWTHALIPVNRFHINSITDPIITPSKVHQITNIQVYICAAAKPLDSTLPNGARTEPLVLALGTSGGALMEVSLTNLNSSEEITLQYKVYVESHCNGSDRIVKELFALHHEFPILASISDDKVLKVWDYESHFCLASKELDPGTTPCAIEFSAGGLLAIGMENGVVIVLSSKDPAWGYQQKAHLHLTPVFSVRESNAAVIKMVFSRDAEYLAVSYNNFKGVSRFGEKNRVKSGGIDITTGFVALFQHDDDNVYTLSMKISLPFGDIKDIGSYPARAECAVSTMEFSEDNLYLSLFHQKIKYSDNLPGNH